MDWQINFLGYRTSIGELIVLAILTLLSALLVEPIRRWLSRAWDLSIDLIASSFDKLRIRRILLLEKKMEMVRQYDDRKTVLRVMKRLVLFIFSVGILILLNVFFAIVYLSIFIQQIIIFLNIRETSASLVEIHQEKLMFVVLFVLIVPLLVSLFVLMTSTEREIDELADPQKTIESLERRIAKLIAKGEPRGP